MPELDAALQSAIGILCEIDSELSRTPPTDSYLFYRALHESAAQFLRVDAFYVCLYAASQQQLFFPYNFDGEFYDGPVNVPLGNGPTSRVIRTRQPVVLCSETEVQHAGGFRFGNTDRASKSAIHVPMRRPDAAETDPLVGVLSTQAYITNAYGQGAVAFLQWLAGRAAIYIRPGSPNESLARRAAAAENLAASRWRQVLDISDRCIQLLQEIASQAERLRGLAESCPKEVQDGIWSLAQTSYRAQTEASQFPLESHAIARSENDRATSDSETNTLTRREREVLDLLGLGKTNTEIAEELYISRDSVKFHCRNIFQKLGITSRAQAIPIAASMRGSSSNSTRPGW